MYAYEDNPRPNFLLTELTWHLRGFKRNDCVLASIEDRSTQRVYTVRCTYLVGCDGAKSAVRRFLGIESEGEDSCEFRPRSTGFYGIANNILRRNYDDHTYQC